MALIKKDFSAYIKHFHFRELFNDMGWNNDKTIQHITIDTITYSLNAVAEKSGFKILVCDPTAEGTIPDYSTRKKIETKVTKLFQEHLIIYVDAKKQEQIWQLVVRQTGKPTKVTETRYHISQDPELLFQRAAGIFFEMDEEENITIVDVTKRVAENFHQNNEKVTKQFYESFKKQHTSFLSFIKGIEGKADKDWYASLMLNRLMFCYFIQKKGFLDKNKNYLRDKLNLCTAKKGKDKFYNFYRSFLLVLFHEGLNEPTQKEKIKIEIGKIPYLNGGLFDEHELEKSYVIDIDDNAFERIFDFFDQYEWHLDTRIEASGKDINPDVIGYIFEKYINDRAQMGAYYTKEDITDYISKNCIIPWLFEETARHYSKAFAAKGEIWTALQKSGDEYIYDAVKFGIHEKLPKDIAEGIKDVAKRTEWNKQAPTEICLPTEIWREVVDRRKRYEEVKAKIEKGEVTAINDFITLNLNIRQFTQDVIENSNDIDFIRAFYKALNSVTIIDPTCGSGAFLFAAMNILEPLYHACIMRMRTFTEDEDRVNELKKKTFSNKYKYFREVLETIQSEQHPNLQYFIYKSIILNNLYGVDIMREAVEIAKLRLFLKLVATVEADYKKKNLGLEPLPDIDFNIRAGNTLIGFATEADLDKALTYTLDGQIAKPAITEKMEIVAMAYKNFKNSQVTIKDYNTIKQDKLDLEKRLKELNYELNLLLHKQANSLKYEKWKESHQPFHWFAEFHEILHGKKGFDVILGNPPYVEYSKIRNVYQIKNYKTETCSNLYAFVWERSTQIINSNGKFGMIVPSSAFTTTRMQSLVELLKPFSNWFSFYDFRPGKLFDGVNIRLAICISHKIKNIKDVVFTTSYLRWYSDERENLFYKRIEYGQSIYRRKLTQKLGSQIETTILKKITEGKVSLANLIGPKNKNTLYFHDAILYWIRATDFAPSHGNYISSHVKTLFFDTKLHLDISCCIMNSTLFYWYWTKISNCRDLNIEDASSFPINEKIKSDSNFQNLHIRLMKDLKKNGIKKTRIQKMTGEVNYIEFYPVRSKVIIDEIDTLLCNHFGLTISEKDYIINYDIKYRMSKELDADDKD